MNDHEKSDGLVVPAKPSNKPALAGAEGSTVSCSRPRCSRPRSPLGGRGRRTRGSAWQSFRQNRATGRAGHVEAATEALDEGSEEGGAGARRPVTQRSTSRSTPGRWGRTGG
jgi:hypothetical protein